MLLLGLLVLSGGGELLVRGASGLARALGIPALIVGLTIVSMGTSAPELVVCVVAAARGESALVLGNAVGSNIINVLVVLGVAAAICPVPIEWSRLKFDAGVMMAASVLLIALCWDGLLARADAGALVLMLALYLWFTLMRARRHSRDARNNESHPPTPRSRLLLYGAMILVGLVGLTFGARWMVDAAEYMANEAGVSKTIIGLTILAGGTSLPELATFVTAAIHKNQELAVGNIIGSNIFNIFGIVGISAFIHPLSVDHQLNTLHFPVMLGAALLLCGVMYFGKKVSRTEGIGLLVAYAGYAGVLVWMTRGGAV